MIPKQLQNGNFSFCRVRKGLKKPIGKGWTRNPYNLDQIIKYIPKDNYGVLTGLNGFGVLDDDTPEKELLKLYDSAFPETMQVRKHYYIILDNWNGNKIIFHHPTELYLDKKGKLTSRMGELQGKGQQVVGAGSLHPSGEIYSLTKDIPIIHIEFSEFIKIFGKYIKKKQVRELKPLTPNNYESDIKDISITQIFPANLDKCPSCNCASGTNFKVYSDTNSYFCFHEWTGGGIWEAIAISEGIKSCSEIGRGCLDVSEAKKVIQIARDKYGLKSPEKQTDLGDPQGWALSVSISSMAQRYNLLTCPTCKTLFQFKDSHGLFYCKTCKQGGGLKKFAELIVQKEATQ